MEKFPNDNTIEQNQVIQNSNMIDSQKNNDKKPHENDKKEFDPNQVTSNSNPWEQVGYHRALGGFFYNLVILVFSAIVSVFFVAYLTDMIYPYPEIQGYTTVANGFFFAIIYQIFDFGTAYGIERFIAEYRVKDPQKMLQYIQFFIWYQMFTGLIQVSVISVVVLKTLVNSEYAYLSWLFLIICQKQWPGMLGTFKSVLSGMQLYNKTNILQFISSDIIQNLTNVIFILLGRWWGSQNPAIGDLMGAVIGTAIGTYVDDFFAMGIAMKYLSNVLKPFGLKTRDLWRFGFTWEVAKKCLWFGVQVSLVPIVNTFTSTMMMYLYLDGMPQYTTWIALRGVAQVVVGIVNTGTFGSTPLIAESYMNGKKKLASFYITTSIRWNGFLMWMLVGVVVAFLPMVFEIILTLPELENYVAAQAFLIPLLIHNLFRPFIDFPNGILIGTEKVSFYTFVRVLEEILQVFFVWFFLYVLKLQDVFGFYGIVFILSFEHFFPRIIKMILCWIYIKKKLFPIQINWWQTLFGPLIASTVVYGAGELWYLLIFKNLVPIIGIMPTAAITLIIGLVCIPFLIYLPLSGILGMWDDFSLETFRKAVDISGPSKFLIKIFYKATILGVSHSKLHNRFKIPWEEASQQIDELMEMKRKSEAKIYEKTIVTAPWMNKKKFDDSN